MKFDNIKWEVRPCHVEDCWCAAIFTVDDKEILGEGSIYKELAEYIVYLHNSHHNVADAPDTKKQKKTSILSLNMDAMKDDALCR